MNKEITHMRFLLYGHGGCYNHGVEAITSCTIAYLRKKYPGCYIILSSHFPEQDREFALKPDEFVARNMEGKDNREIYQNTLDKITPDTVVIHLGGDNYCYPNWQRYALVHEEAVKRGAKSILWGCSIDEDMLNEEMIKTLSGHDLILAREVVTYRNLVGLGLNNVRKVSDIAFGMACERPKGDFLCKRTIEDLFAMPYVLLNISPLVCRRNPDVKKAYICLRDYVLENTDYNILLMPHVLMPMDNDYEILQDIMVTHNKRMFLASDKLHAWEYKYLVSKAALCVASRTHVTIAAYSTTVPTLAVGYSTKARGIAEDLGLSEYVVDVKRDDIVEALLIGFKQLSKNDKLIRNHLMGIIQKYKNHAGVGDMDLF